MPPSAIHKNDSRKKKGKGQSNANVAVFPIQTVQPQVHEKTVVVDEAPPPSPPPALKIERELVKMPTTASVNPIRVVSSSKLSIPICRGQIAKPQPVQTSGVVSTVADMIHSTIPISSTNTSDQPEKIDWVELQRCQTGDPSKWVDFLVIGLARGFQIWILNEESHWEEVISERQGPIRLGKLLPHNPEPLNPNDKDILSSQRPLFAIVDASSPNMDKQFCTFTIISLATAQKFSKFTFDEPISSIQTSNKFIALGLPSVIVVLDSFAIQERFRIPITPPSEGFAPSMSLCSTFLAFAHPKVEHAEMSCGGLSLEQKENASVTGQMIQVLSRTMNSLSESVSGPNTRGSGLVGVVDLLNTCPSSSSNPTIIARFLAHLNPLSHISFSPDGRCLATADESGNSFHVFMLMPHPVNIGLGAVQHLYRLHRGNTPAKIISSCWSLDGRWLGIATNHGTSHIFAVCPYGGTPSYRTHNSRLANRESRFLRSAGLAEESVIGSGSMPRERTHSGSPLTDKKHAAMDKGALSKAALNSRIGPYPPPVTLYTVKKIRESSLSADKISAWASDITPVALASSNGRRLGVSSSSRLSLLLSSNNIYIARADGLVCSYEMRVQRSNSVDDPLKLEMIPTATWTLIRTKKGDDVRAPLPRESTLMSVLYEKEKIAIRRKCSLEERDWIPEVEVHAYSAPHRRLWQGPQFSFYSYNEERSTNLVAPAQKCVPIVMGGHIGKGEDLMEATRIECGSWSSDKERHGVLDNIDDISKAITEAMKDVEVEQEDTRLSDDEFFDTASGGGNRYEKKEDLLQFDDF